jgi:hypothetical protein
MVRLFPCSQQALPPLPHILPSFIKYSIFKLVTSPITTTIRIQPCSKCSTIWQTFFSDKTLGLEKNGGGIIIFGQNINLLEISKGCCHQIPMSSSRWGPWPPLNQPSLSHSLNLCPSLFTIISPKLNPKTTTYVPHLYTIFLEPTVHLKLPTTNPIPPFCAHMSNVNDNFEFSRNKVVFLKPGLSHYYE